MSDAKDSNRIGTVESTNDDSSRNGVNTSSKKTFVTSFDIWALGITIVIGGQYFSWNFGLVAGVGTYGIAVLIIGIGYITLICNISEITSGLPFTGGSYGLARCALGNYWGFVIGCSETLEYIFYVAAAVIALELMFELILPNLQHYPPVTWLVIYVFCVLIHIFGGQYFWIFNRFLAVLSILVVLMFVFGSMKYVDFSQYAAWSSTTDEPTVSSPWFVGDINKFMQVYPLAAWLYVGVESLKETCNEVEEPKIQVPRGQVSCVVTLIITSILVYFTAVSIPPGIVSMSSNSVPFNAGFELMFDLTAEQTLQYATILSIPATFATAFGFIMMYGKIMTAMANSKLMPLFLKAHYSKTGAPYMSLIVGSVLSYGVCLVSYWYKDLTIYIFNICILAGFCSYSLQCICYILIKTKYSNIERHFVSPFGLIGGVVSLCVWVLGIISVACFQNDDQKALIAVCVLFGSFTVWYFIYAKYQQSFSDEEKEIFFRLYVINRKSITNMISYNRKLIYIILYYFL